MSKRPRGDIARSAEKQILDAIENRAAELKAAGEEALSEVVSIKRDQLFHSYAAAAKLREKRKVRPQQAAE